MRSKISIGSSQNVLSALVNCLCPECGGAIELRSNQFICLGRCGKQWRDIWESTKRAAVQPPQSIITVALARVKAECWQRIFLQPRGFNVRLRRKRPENGQQICWGTNSETSSTS